MEAETVVRVSDLVTIYGEKRIHDGVSLDIHRGEIFAIVGGSGSGKSTLMREMAMLQIPTAGSVELFGKHVNHIEASECLALRRQIGVMFQSGALFTDLTVLENVSFPLHEHTRLSEHTIRELAQLKIYLAGLDASAGALLPSQLSGGMRKRAALARALALDPALLFLDEPGSGLDPISADALDQLIVNLRNSLGLTLVFITHDIPSVWEVADRVALLGEGKVLQTGTVSELSQSCNPAVRGFFEGPRGAARAG